MCASTLLILSGWKSASEPSSDEITIGEASFRGLPLPLFAGWSFVSLAGGRCTSLRGRPRPRLVGGSSPPVWVLLLGLPGPRLGWDCEAWFDWLAESALRGLPGPFFPAWLAATGMKSPLLSTDSHCDGSRRREGSWELGCSPRRRCDLAPSKAMAWGKVLGVFFGRPRGFAT